jgi:hypothetical protein
MFAKLRISQFLGIIPLVLLTISLLGQNTTGSIVGHIKDPSGAVIVGGKVSVMEMNTRDSRSVTTNQNGDYTVPLLKPGHYSVTIEANGFKSETQSGISLDVDQIVRADLSLSVGATSESVTIKADTVTLDTDTASVGEVLGGKMIEDLPLNGRNFQDLLLNTPGVVSAAYGAGEQGSQRIFVSGNTMNSIGVEGGRGGSNGYTMDGTSIIDVGEQTPAFQPSLDDIAEFKLQTKTYSAAYGFNANQINMSSKAGTNEYHGTIFEYLRNNAVDAKPFGATAGVTIPLLQQNQFGYALGGPVRIPRLYDGRRRTFFFANYEGFRQKAGGEGAAVVPTLDQLAGTLTPEDLGAVQPGGARTQCGRTYNAGDPLPLFNPYDPNGCPFPLSNGVYTVPSGMISAIGKLAQRPGLYFPASGPNIPNAPRGTNNYAYNAPTTINYDQQNYRIDQNIGIRDAIFIHAVKQDENELSAAGAVTPASQSLRIQPSRFYTTTETHTFTPSFTNQFRIGYLETVSGYHEPVEITPSDLASLNFHNPYTLPQDGYPRLTFGGGDALLNDGVNPSQVSYESPVLHVVSTWDGGDSAYKVWRRHTFNFGANLRRTHFDTQIGSGLGYFSFNGQYSGDDVADLLMGAAAGVNTVEVGPLASPSLGLMGHMHLLTWATYFQDDWKVSQDLTVNLGIRYEYTATPSEENGLFVWPDFNAPGGAEYVVNKSLVNAYAGTNPFGSGGLYVSPPNGKILGGSQKSAFAPRCGFAYRPFHDDKTVVRGGYGLYYDEYEENELTNSESVVGVSSAVNTPGGYLALSYPAVYNMDHLPAAGSGGGNSPVISNWLPNSPATGDANPSSQLGFLVQVGGAYRQPYVENWALSVERELPANISLEVDYVGAHDVHLFDRQNPNQPIPCNSATSCTVTANGPSVPNQDRVPYKNLGTLVNTLFNGWGNYNGLDVKVEHRTGDLTLLANYTWSKQMDVASSVAGLYGDSAGWAGPQDSHNNTGDYARGDYDVGQRAAASLVYALPVGRGKKLTPNISRLADEVIGGWEISAILLFQGGEPFSVTAADIGGSNGTYAERADLNLSHPPGGFKRSTTHWFSSSATPRDPNAQFTQPDPGRFGTSSRNAVRGPGQEDADFSAFKYFALGDKVRFQFRFDAFNAFNHYDPGLPVQGIGPTAGYIARTGYQRSARILQGSLRFQF